MDKYVICYFLGAPEKQFSAIYLDLVARLLLMWVCCLLEESLFGTEERLLGVSTGVVETRKLLHLRVTVALSLSGRSSRSRTWISCFRSITQQNTLEISEKDRVRQKPTKCQQHVLLMFNSDLTKILQCRKLNIKQLYLEFHLSNAVP